VILLDQHEDRIVRVLQKANQDLTITDIVKETGITRNTVAKYLMALEKEGRVEETRRIGHARLYRIAKKE